MALTDTQQVILDALAEHEAEFSIPGVWTYRYLNGIGGRSLSDRVHRLWKKRFPERRNMPSHATVEHAIEKLLRDGLIEYKEGKHDSLYRVKEAC